MSPKLIFVSYSHKDVALGKEVIEHLKNLEHSGKIQVWTDERGIRAGDKWLPPIEKALSTADMGVLLISKDFLNSDFIRRQELPRLHERQRRSALRLIPVLLEPCSWKSIKWLSKTEIRPRGDRALSEIHHDGLPLLARALAEITNEIATIILGEETNDSTVPPSDTTEYLQDDTADTAAIKLVGGTVLHGLTKEGRNELARSMVNRVASVTGLKGNGLFNAVRFCIEYHLLKSSDLLSPILLRLSAGNPLEENPDVRQLVEQLKTRARSEDFSDTPIDVLSLFFSRVLERQEDWKRYFDVLHEAGGSWVQKASIATLCQIRVVLGFISPQYLIAGLLSRFDDDWRPVINAYQRRIPERRNAPFECLQASQWTCWLVWGPSIPICQCEQWRGLVAYQYGYGDENNSLPLIELNDIAKVSPSTLGEIVALATQDGRLAQPVALTGRLRWGPWFLRSAASVEPDQPEESDDDLGEADRLPEAATEYYAVAPVQETLFNEHGLPHQNHGDGLVLELGKVEKVHKSAHAYFSAYLWLMFLVAVSPREPSIGPSLLRGRAYPSWPENESSRRHVEEARLWEDLLPVFLHANLADPVVLAFQKQLLVANALQLLHEVWNRRVEMFSADDVRAGIQFHLVCASDYTGCGCQVRFPSSNSSLALLRTRLEAETDREFAAAVVLPAIDEDPNCRPWGLAGYFSACHMPERVADYYKYVSRLPGAKVRE